MVCKRTGCHYYCKNTQTCDYRLITGFKRPCEAGINCTSFTTQPPKRFVAKAIKDNTTEDEMYTDCVVDIAELPEVFELIHSGKED